ncbi:MAG: LuxR C-terminal-related transcriptional regulator [Polyangiaceae bacterium]
MGKTGRSDAQTTLDLVEALGSSLDLRAVLERAYPLLLRLVPADYGALGISTSGLPQDYEWLVQNIPPAFFAAYPDMAPHDFVRESVASRPNVVLRDEDMISRRDLMRNMMYRRAREVGAPMEHVMSVMLHVDDRWQSGLSLYRERARSFTQEEQMSLQRVTPMLANAVRSSQLFGAASDWASALEMLLAREEACSILLSSPSTEIGRTRGAERLLERWFLPHERRSGRVPEDLAALVVHAASHGHMPVSQIRSRDGAALEGTIRPLSGALGKPRWLITLRETSLSEQGSRVPRRWRSLVTSREAEVIAAVLRGWDNHLIAEELGCSVGTVKKHLQRVFDKLGLPSRAALIARANELSREDDTEE